MAFVLTTPISGGSTITGLATTVINGQPMLTLVDVTRGNKTLSVAENPIMWSENKLGNRDWVQIGTANHSKSAYVADFNGTITYATGQCENVNNKDKDIHLYINNIDMGIVGSLTGSTLATFINTTIDIDFNQGDEIRLRAVNINNGQIQDTVIKLTLKWRGI